MLWAPPTDSVTSALASVSASLASPVSTASAARSTTLGSDPKAANVRAVAGTEPQSPLIPGRATDRSRRDVGSCSPQGSPPGLSLNHHWCLIRWILPFSRTLGIESFPGFFATSLFMSSFTVCLILPSANLSFSPRKVSLWLPSFPTVPSKTFFYRSHF